MQNPSRPILAAMVLLALVLFTTGSNWGLPSSETDKFLFGRHRIWSGREILELAGKTGSGDRPADVSSKPLDRSQVAVVVNATDRDRARIVRRYRLMSYQPDEFATFAALAQMKPSRMSLDPRMYKYGGLWIYPVGAFLKIAGRAGAVRLNPDIGYYLDHPEQFGRFYVIARWYSAAWGCLGVIAVFLIVRRCCGQTPAAICGAFCFMMMPVVTVAAHEAKPHLAGCVLMLFAVLAGAAFVEHGSRKLALTTAILCGAAVAMVPSACFGLLVLPAMVLLRRLQTRADTRPAMLLCQMAGWIAISGIVYFAANPYVLINLFRDRAVLRADFGNSSAFYQFGISRAGVGNALILVGLGSSFLLALAGVLGGLALAWRATKVACDSSEERRRRATGMLLALVALPVAIFFLLAAARQPADYARFALPFDVFLAVEAVVAVATFIRPPIARGLCLSILVATTAMASSFYLRGFLRDTTGRTSRLAAASQLEELLRTGGRVLVTREEPAPWSLPPVDLFRTEVVLISRQMRNESPLSNGRLTVGPAGLPQQFNLRGLLTGTAISWADKRFEMEPDDGVRSGLLGASNPDGKAVH